MHLVYYLTTVILLSLRILIGVIFVVNTKYEEYRYKIRQDVKNNID